MPWKEGYRGNVQEHSEWEVQNWSEKANERSSKIVTFSWTPRWKKVS